MPNIGDPASQFGAADVTSGQTSRDGWTAPPLPCPSPLGKDSSDRTGYPRKHLRLCVLNGVRSGNTTAL